MRRREFIAATAALLVSPRSSRAQGTRRRLGFLAVGEASSRLRELSHSRRNIICPRVISFDSSPRIDHMRPRCGRFVPPSRGPVARSSGPRDRSRNGVVPAPVRCHQGTVTLEELAAHGATETTKLLALKPRLRCTKCGGQYADLQPDWSQRTVGFAPVRLATGTCS
jgi:hypothetical protein